MSTGLVCPLGQFELLCRTSTGTAIPVAKKKGGGGGKGGSSPP